LRDKHKFSIELSIGFNSSVLNIVYSFLPPDNIHVRWLF